jgi:thiol-disulfide isomerase/thioredoxin
VNRNTLLGIAVAVGSMLAGIVLFQWYDNERSSAPAHTGATAPLELHSIPLTHLDGAEGLLSDYRGRILVVNFWAPWCAPCRREIPALIDLQRSYPAETVTILGFAFDGADPVREFAAEYDIEYPLFLAGARSAMYNAALGNPTGALPYTALLDADLQIRFQHNGEVTREQLETALKPLLPPSDS